MTGKTVKYSITIIILLLIVSWAYCGNEDYIVGYVYRPKEARSAKCFTDLPFDLNKIVISNFSFKDIDLLERKIKEFKPFKSQDYLSGKERKLFLYDYYNPTYEGYLFGNHIGIFLTGTYPAADVLSTNLLNPTLLYHSKKLDVEKALEKTRMIFIPAGALQVHRKREDVKKKFKQFVSTGGVLFCTAQAYGVDYDVLPGYPLDGVGYVSDQADFHFSAYVDQDHPILSSIKDDLINAHFDGYLTEYPKSTQVLLRRRSNGQPCLVIYPYGKGYVIVSTLYTEFAYGNDCASFDEIKLIRDIIAWSRNPLRINKAGWFKRHKMSPNSEIIISKFQKSYNIPLEITNPGKEIAESIEVNFCTPEKNIVFKKVFNTNLNRTIL